MIGCEIVSASQANFVRYSRFAISSGTKIDATWSVFFFSSRRRHTRLQGDWSSDVCSSDLGGRYCVIVDRKLELPEMSARIADRALENGKLVRPARDHVAGFGQKHSNVEPRSEERRVGKEGRSRWSPYH